MTRFFYSARWLRPALASAAAVAFPHAARACGPDFPNAYLSNSLDELTSLPTLNFDRELARIVPISARARLSKADHTDDPLVAELAEVREALSKEGLSPRAIEAAISAYSRDQPPAPLPTEFQLYAAGARAWHQEDYDEALGAWRRLLALPPDQRRYRTVWAAYMIGRTLWDSNPERAREALHLAETAAREGFPDSQGLAIAGLGWEARSHLHEGDTAIALKTYLRQYELGDPTAGPSIQRVLMGVFSGAAMEGSSADLDPGAAGESHPRGGASDAVLVKLANDAVLRGVVTAWFASRGGPSLPWGQEAAREFGRWIRSLPDSGKLSPEEADRWCWVAYQNGYWKEARQLADRAPAEAPASEWVRSMLLLRSGSVDDAAAHLGVAARSFRVDSALEGSPEPGEPSGGTRSEWQPLGDSPSRQLGGVRGVLALRRDQYVEALRLFLDSNHWSDAAYVAERVLTADELIAFVRAERLSGISPPGDSPSQAERSLEYLLARRLVRLERFDEAREFFPKEILGTYGAYLSAVRAGYDVGLSHKIRADSFWAAARLMREKGMELQGTELEPDYFVWDGNFEWPVVAESRREPIWSASRRTEREVIGPSGGELDRTRKVKSPGHRYHYRYRAAELAWLAAALLPDDAAQTALVLNTAGGWIADRDPEAAEVYYKTLVVRCPNTEIGKQAAARNWLVRAEAK